MLNADQKKAIEDEHNVYIDAEYGMFNISGYGAESGWDIIPPEWIAEITD